MRCEFLAISRLILAVCAVEAQVSELESAVDGVPQNVMNNEEMTPDERLEELDALTRKLQVLLFTHSMHGANDDICLEPMECCGLP